MLKCQLVRNFHQEKARASTSTSISDIRLKTSCNA